MTDKSPKSPKCVSISSLAIFFIAIFFVVCDFHIPETKCIIDTIL